MSLKGNKKTALVLAVLISISAVLTFYTACAHYVASYVGEYDGNFYWPTTGYTFFPWPKTSTGIVIQIMVPLGQPDLQYYEYIIKPGVLIIMTLLFWIVVAWMVWKIRKSAHQNNNN